jgi:phage I-like protein
LTAETLEQDQVGAFDIDGADVALLFGVDWSSVVPSEIRLFGNGMTATKKGDFLFDEESGATVMAAFEEQGMDKLPFDAAHGMLNPNAPPDAHKALGWFVPTVKDDIEGGGGVGLFAADIEWTELGLAALKKREFRFFSPAITFDGESRRITGLINVALTNIPATKNQRPLVLDALEADENNNNIEDQDTMKVLLDTLGASDETGAVAKVGDLQSFQTAVLSALDVPADKAAEKIAELSAAAIDAVAQLEAVKAERVAADKVAKLDALCAAGKLPPAQKEFASSLSDDQLDQFVVALSSVTAVTKTVEEPGGHSKVETLSAEEKKVCQLLGLSEEDMLAEKALAKESE